MCFPKNFAKILRKTILQNADRWLLLKYFQIIKIAAPEKLLVLMGKFCKRYPLELDL